MPSTGGPVGAPRHLGATRGSLGPDRHPGTAIGGTDPRARAHPVRADGCLGLRVLPWRSGHHGGGPGRHGRGRNHGPALRRCPPDELRSLRDAGAIAGLRAKRLRRDPTWAGRVGGAVLGTLRAYREAMRDFAAQRDLDVWYSMLPAKELQAQPSANADPKSGKEVKREVRKALRRDHLRAFDRLIETVDGEVRFADEPPSWSPSRSCSTTSSGPGTWRSSSRSSRSTARACHLTFAPSPSGTGSSTSRGRSWASAASAREPGWCS